MTLWFVFALMTAAAVFAVLWPLSRRGAPAHGGSDLAVYRDQLEEVARDRAAGRIGETEAEAAKIEISRRLLAAADAAKASEPKVLGSPLRRRRAVAVVALLLVPACAATLYLWLGSPQLPGEPLAARMAAAHANAPVAKLVAQVEAHLEKNPNDARGYAVLAPVYLRLGRFADAVNANRKVIALSGETAEREADLGEALTAAANGIVTAEAKAAFDRAVALDANTPKATFFLGLAAQQDGDRDKAAAIWRDMLARAPAGAPWAATVQQALADIGQAPSAAPTETQPGPSGADVAAAANMSEKERGEMIRGMVAQLAGKLKENGGDVDGWQRLLRAYVVLGERDKAQAAAIDARKALAGDGDKLRKLEDAIKSLGLT